MASPMIPPPHAPDFLAASGWSGAEILPLAGDASFRRYFRVVHGDRSAVLMDAPPPHEDPRPFIAVAEWLIGRGLSAPEIIARDLEKGCCFSVISERRVCAKHSTPILSANVSSMS